MKRLTLALAGALALAAAGPSLAQPAPGPTPAAGREHHRPDPAEKAQRHAEHLRAVLQLRPDQEPALRALTEAMKADPARMHRGRQERAEMRNLTTPQRLDRAQARMTERQAAFTRKADAIRRFYAQLTPAQQKAFDAMHQGHGGRGHGKHGRGGHGGRG